MSLTHRTVRITLHVLVLLIVALTSSPVIVHGKPGHTPRGADKPLVVRHSPAVKGGTHILQSVSVPNVLDLAVVQQPAADHGYVAASRDQVTQFSLAARYGNIGLLAHNYLSGRLFSRLVLGEQVRVLYADGQVEDFIITEILRYQALMPESPLSSLRNLSTDQVSSAAQVFRRVYTGKHHLTFQTCIASPDSPSWGRLFVIAVPVGTQSRQHDPGRPN